MHSSALGEIFSFRSSVAIGQAEWGQASGRQAAARRRSQRQHACEYKTSCGVGGPTYLGGTRHDPLSVATEAVDTNQFDPPGVADVYGDATLMTCPLGATAADGAGVGGGS